MWHYNRSHDRLDGSRKSRFSENKKTTLACAYDIHAVKQCRHSRAHTIITYVSDVTACINHASRWFFMFFIYIYTYCIVEASAYFALPARRGNTARCMYCIYTKATCTYAYVCGYYLCVDGCARVQDVYTTRPVDGGISGPIDVVVNDFCVRYRSRADDVILAKRKGEKRADGRYRGYVLAVAKIRAREWEWERRKGRKQILVAIDSI